MAKSELRPEDDKPILSLNSIRKVCFDIMRDQKPNPNDPEHYFSQGIETLMMAIEEDFRNQYRMFTIFDRAKVKIATGYDENDKPNMTFVISTNADEPITAEEEIFMRSMWKTNTKLNFVVNPNYE